MPLAPDRALVRRLTAACLSWAAARRYQFEDDGEELVNHIIRNTRRYVHLFSLAADNLMPPPSVPVRRNDRHPRRRNLL